MHQTKLRAPVRPFPARFAGRSRHAVSPVPAPESPRHEVLWGVRDAEVEQLRRAQQLAVIGHGQVATIVGDAGVGKSRLVYEFTHSHRLHGWLTLESASVSYGKATTYLPVIDLLKSYFKIQDREPLLPGGDRPDPGGDGRAGGRSTAIASWSKSSALPITPSGASCGRRRWTTSGRPDSGQARGQRSWTPGLGSSRRWESSRRSRRARPRWNRASRSALNWGRCWCGSANPDGGWRTRARPKSSQRG